MKGIRIIDHEEILNDEQRKKLISIAQELDETEEFDGTCVRFPDIPSGHDATWSRGLDGEWAWFVEN